MNLATVSVELLRKIPLFQNLNNTELRQLAEISRAISFPPAEAIMRQGECCQNLWVVLEGHCEVFRVPPSGKPAGERLVLATLEPHAAFGEMSFFHKAPHSATVVARSEVKLLRIQRVDFDELIDDGAIAAYKLAFNALAGLAERLRRMDDWVAELSRRNGAREEDSNSAPLPRTTEWTEFREKMFQGWNL
jgi:CRP-like cAMP-binding protein